MKLKSLIVALALLPGVAFAQYTGHSQRNILGGYDYYASPGYQDNMAGWRLFAETMSDLRRSRIQQEQFQQQLELQRQQLELQRQQMALDEMIRQWESGAGKMPEE